jgi:CheY-like chemotaxis protein
MGTLEMPVEILLVEDNPGDVELIRRSLRDSAYHYRLTVVGDGEDAMAVLRKEGEHEAAPRPDLILLDLNLPKKDGREVLAEVKEDSDLQSIPVVVLTTSRTQQDILAAYGLHANSYVNKPADARTFNSVIGNILEYWVNISNLPRTS